MPSARAADRRSPNPLFRVTVFTAAGAVPEIRRADAPAAGIYWPDDGRSEPTWGLYGRSLSQPGHSWITALPERLELCAALRHHWSDVTEAVTGAIPDLFDDVDAEFGRDGDDFERSAHDENVLGHSPDSDASNG